MSRLDSFIRRMQAQRDCLNMLAVEIAAVPGPVFELGLGNGRTYDHLRGLFPEREIFVFERKPAAHPACTPPATHLFEGEITETLAAARARFAGQVALIHSDIGAGDEAANRALAEKLAVLLAPFPAPGGVIACDQALPGVLSGASSGVTSSAPWAAIDLPPGVPAGRYNLYRA
ncbi:MAG: class I SAM-dependent methyltransferase [Rhodospirillales bacterium]